MTPFELREALAAISMHQTVFARALAVDERTVRRWVAGERPIPPFVPRLLTLFEVMPAARQRLEAMIPPKPKPATETAT